MMNPFDAINDVDSDAELPEILGDDDESEYSEEDDDLFVLEQLAWEPTRTQGKLVSIAVGRDTIIVGTDKRVVILLRVDCDPQLFVVGKKEDLIHNLFVDRDANHLIVTMKNGLNFYINLTSTHSTSRRKQTQTALSKVKGITIESMVWNRTAYRDSTGLCLCGTSNGCIYSLQISDGKEKIFNKLYDLKTGSYGNTASQLQQPNINHSESTCFRVCGLHIEYLNSAKEFDDDDINKKGKDDKEYKDDKDQQIQALKSLGFVDSDIKKKTIIKKMNDNESKRFYIIAVIPSKIFEFIGGPTYEDVFKFYDDKQDIFKEIPGSLKHTKLCVYKPHNGMAEAIGWLTEPGIVLCRPVFGSHVTPKTGVIGNNIHENIIGYDNEQVGSGVPENDWHGMNNIVPISFAVTQFHIILIYINCYLVINRLNKKCVTYEKIPCKQNENVINIAHADNFIYVMSSSQIFQVRSVDESRDVWELFLANKDFINAKKYARNNIQKIKILREEAEYYFETSRFTDAALKYVELSDIDEDNKEDHIIKNMSLDISFEEIALKFLNVGATDALMTFLKQKLNRMHNDDKTQRVILVTWLTEMHLSKINTSSCIDYEDFQRTITEFEDFLKAYRTTLGNCKQVIFDLIASHGRTKQLVEFARIQQDYKWVINYYVQNHEYKMAIRVLATLQKPSQHEELYYEFAPILMYFLPTDTVNMLIKVQCLDPKKLIPALMRYDMSENINNITHTNESIRYLVYCIEKGHEKSKDPAIHNYLISLYCKQKSEKELLKFIEQYSSSSNNNINNTNNNINKKKPLFDVKYALRLCHQEKKNRSCVELYKIMKLYEEAIRLALTIPYNNYELAKNIASSIDNINGNHSIKNRNEQKRLWLIIARHVVNKLETDEINQVLKIINESQCLSIEDILPHLKDFTEIGPFKKDIKQSLEKYSLQIQKLQKEMDNYTNNAQQIRKDTKQLLLRSSMITSNRKCDLTGKPILNTQFILFPCTHIFRFDSLTKRIFEYKKEINDNKPFKTQKELYNYAQKQCPLCGDMMIHQVTKPFINFHDENDIKEAESWHIPNDKINFTYNNQNNQNNINQMNNQQSQKPKTVFNLEDINIADLGI